MKNIMKQKLSIKAIQRGLWMGALLLSAASASAQTPLSFSVDMSSFPGGVGNIPAGDTVCVAGAFDGWNANHILTNTSGTLWTGTFANSSVSGGSMMDYQFRVVEANNTTVDDYADTSSGDNYCALIPNSGPLTLPSVYWNDDGPAAVSTIYFQVDMAEQANIGFNQSMTVAVSGSFEGTGWSQSFHLTNDYVHNVTNGQGAITSMPYGGFCPVWNNNSGNGNVGTSTNGSGEYKYTWNGNYETVPSGDILQPGDPDTGNNRVVINTTQVLPKVWFSDVPWVPNVTDNVYFVVDMSVQAELGNFYTPTENAVYIDGNISQFSSWANPGYVMTNNPGDPDTNQYWFFASITGAPGYPGAYYQYVLQPNFEWPSGNTTYTMSLTGGTFTNGLNPTYYWNNVGPGATRDSTAAQCNVTFTVDMTPAVTGVIDGDLEFTEGVDTVEINGLNNGVSGSWWGWTPLSDDIPSQYIMTWMGPSYGNGNIYTVTIPVNQGQPLDVTYKYGIDGQDNEAGMNDNHFRYIRSQTNYSMPVDLFGSQGASISTEATRFGNLSASQSGNDVVLSWLGMTGVSLQSTPSLDPPVTWTSLPLTDGTNLIVTPGPNLNIAPSAVLTTNVSTSYSIGNGGLFYRLVAPQ
jgi:hypothetical protein